MARNIAEKVTYPIVPQKTALLIVDMQNDFVKPGAAIQIPAAHAMVPKLSELIKQCRKAGVTVVYIRHVLRGDGSDAGRLADLHTPIRDGKALCAGTDCVEIFEGLKPEPGDIIVEKPRYSAFYGTDLEAVLHTRGIDTLIIAGTVTNVCVDSTAKDAFSRDYKIIFLSDGTATRDWPDMGWGPQPAEMVQRVVLTVIAASFGQVASIDEVLTELSKL